MLRRLRCPRGHTWQAEIQPALGETTRLLPACPVCGEIGDALAESTPRAKLVDAPTSRLDIIIAEPETEAVTMPQDQSFPRISGYELVEEIGRGGMGVVYKAWDIKRATHVAVKVLPRLDPAAVLRFKQEFRALVDLQHPNLAGIFELGTTDGFFYLVMEHITGDSFTDYFHNIADPNERITQLRDLLAQLLDGLEHLHEHGLLHCDIKPANVLVTPERRVVLLDFGLVTSRDLIDAPTGELMGSLGYIAPERFQAKSPTPACDWYALGVMLFEIFVGRRPFTGEQTKLIWQHQHFDPPSPRELGVELPEVWDQLCHALLQREPALRADGRVIRRRLDLPPSRIEDLTQGPRKTPLLGRDLPLIALRSAFEQTLSGKLVFVHVSGRSGMGKTTLVERFLERTAAREPIWILRGRCFENESVPFKGIDGIVDSLSQLLVSLSDDELEPMLPAEMATLARVFPVLRRVKLGARGWRSSDISNPSELRRRVVHILAELLTRMSTRRPVIMFLDDFQWADADSAQVLLEMMVSSMAPPVLLLWSYRSEDHNVPCVRFVREHLPPVNDRFVMVEQPVEPLSSIEAGSLADVLLADLPQIGESWSDRIAAQSDGWPIHVHELCRYVRQLGPQDDWSGPPPELTLRMVIAERLRRLTATQRELVEVLAVAGQPLPVDVALQAAATPRIDRTTLVVLRADHWLRTVPADAGHLVECAHATIREAVLAMMSAERAAELHERLARAHASIYGVEPELLAAHLLAAGQGAEAASLYEQAAERADEKLAFDRAAHLFRLALELQPRESEKKDALLLRLAASLAHAGRGAEAAGVFVQAADRADRTRRSQLRRLAAYHYCTSGLMEQGWALLSDVLTHAHISIPSSPERMRASLVWERLRLRWRGIRYQVRQLGNIPAEDLERVELCWSATAGMSLYDIVAGAYFQCLHLRHALDTAEPLRIARALAWEAGHLATEGPAEFQKAERRLLEARTIAGRTDEPSLMALIDLVDGILAHCRGNWPTARQLLLGADEVFATRCIGVAWERATTHAFLFWTLFQLGALTEMAAMVQRLTREAQHRGDRFAETNFATFAQPLCLVRGGQSEEARQLVRTHVADWTLPGFHLQHLTALWTECRLDLYDGKIDDALQRLIAAWPIMRKAEMFRVQTIRITLQVLKASIHAAAAARGHVSKNTRALGECARDLHHERLPWADAHATMARSLVAHLTQDVTMARDLAAQAIAKFEHLGMTTHAASARWWLVHLSRKHSGDVAAADEALRREGIVDSARFARMQLGATIPA